MGERGEASPCWIPPPAPFGHSPHGLLTFHRATGAMSPAGRFGAPDEGEDWAGAWQTARQEPGHPSPYQGEVGWGYPLLTDSTRPPGPSGRLTASGCAGRGRAAAGAMAARRERAYALCWLGSRLLIFFKALDQLGADLAHIDLAGHADGGDLHLHARGGAAAGRGAKRRTGTTSCGAKRQTMALTRESHCVCRPRRRRARQAPRPAARPAPHNGARPPPRPRPGPAGTAAPRTASPRPRGAPLRHRPPGLFPRSVLKLARQGFEFWKQRLLPIDKMAAERIGRGGHGVSCRKRDGQERVGAWGGGGD